MWLWVKTNGTGRCTTQFYFSGDWDIHWGYGLLTHGHVAILVPWLHHMAKQLEATPGDATKPHQANPQLRGAAVEEVKATQDRRL